MLVEKYGISFAIHLIKTYGTGVFGKIFPPQQEDEFFVVRDESAPHSDKVEVVTQQTIDNNYDYPPVQKYDIEMGSQLVVQNMNTIFDEFVKIMFREWKAMFNKEYSSELEHDERFLEFKKKYINMVQYKNFETLNNKYMDLTYEEYQAIAQED